MARRSTRRNSRGGFSIFSRVYSPLNHLLCAVGDTVNEVATTVGKVFKTSVGGVNRVGKSLVGHANAAVRNVTRRRR
jgi:hypothetical protein